MLLHINVFLLGGSVPWSSQAQRWGWQVGSSQGFPFYPFWKGAQCFPFSSHWGLPLTAMTFQISWRMAYPEVYDQTKGLAWILCHLSWRYTNGIKSHSSAYSQLNTWSSRGCNYETGQTESRISGSCVTWHLLFGVRSKIWGIHQFCIALMQVAII